MSHFPSFDSIDDPEGEDFGFVPTDQAYVFDHITQSSVLPDDVQSMLSARGHDGDPRAFEVLVRHNTRLVVEVANQFRPSEAQHHAFTAGGLEYGDLLQEGFLALGRAAQHWEPKTGTKFSSYAMPAIKSQMVEAIRNMDAAIRLPREVQVIGWRIDELQRGAALDGLPPLTSEQLAERLEVSEATIARVQNAAQVSTSLNKPVGEDDSAALLDLVEDREQVDVYEQLADFEPRQIREALSKLKPRDYDILASRHFEGESLSSIADRYGFSIERARELERRAGGKLKQQLRLAKHPLAIARERAEAKQREVRASRTSARVRLQASSAQAQQTPGPDLPGPQIKGMSL